MINCLRRIAIVGATGQVGTSIVQALLKADKYHITALTRQSGAKRAEFDPRLDVRHVDYDSPDLLRSALQGHDALIITLAKTVGGDVQERIVEAAVAAKVGYVFLNWWGLDSQNKTLGEDLLVGMTNAALRKRVEQLAPDGTTSWINLCCGFWYEYSLAGDASRFGFDVSRKHLTLYDDGLTPMNTTTWTQVGNAVAHILALPDQSMSPGSSACLTQYRNQHVYVSSFRITQQALLDSIVRISGDSRDSWSISSISSAERFKQNMLDFKAGDRASFGMALYARTFYPNGDGDYQSKYPLINTSLGLPEEDLDSATRVALALFPGI